MIDLFELMVLKISSSLTGPQSVLRISSNIPSLKKSFTCLQLYTVCIMQVKDGIWTGLQKFQEIR